MRLFIAINLPARVREALWEVTAPLRQRALPLKWVPPEGLHLTLKFLGEVAEERAGAVSAALARAAGDEPRRGIPLSLGGFGVFPDPRRPRVVWVGVAPEPALELLQHRVEQLFAPLGFPTEGRPFRPHLTLARAVRDAGPAALQGLNEGLATLQFAETVLVESVEVMRSTLERGGAVYQVQRSERLV